MTSETEVGSGSTQRVVGDSIWLRGLFMLLFLLIYGVAEAVVVAVAVVQFGWCVLTEGRNLRLKGFAESLSEFIYQIVGFWTFTHDEKPFPFSDWPPPRARAEEE